jgi:hypothetical protein
MSNNTGILSGIWMWMLERYPPAIVILHALVYITAVSVSAYLTGSDGTTIELNVYREIWGIFVFFSFPLVLRIIDEHKDFERDCITHPNRVLQRGDTSLEVLAKLGWGCAIFQAIYSLYVDNGLASVFIMWLATIGYSLLMAKEFFCGEWLEKRMVLYAITHQLVTPISMLWICSVSISPSYPSLDIWGFLLTALFCTFSYEIGRKIRAPKDEKEGVDSYTKSIGLRMAPIVTAFLFLGAAGVPVFWFEQIGLVEGLTNGLLVANGIVLLLCAGVCGLFVHDPQKKWAKSIEGGAAVMTLWVYGWIFYAISVASGVSWIW